MVVMGIFNRRAIASRPAVKFKLTGRPGEIAAMFARAPTEAAARWSAGRGRSPDCAGRRPPAGAAKRQRGRSSRRSPTTTTRAWRQDEAGGEGVRRHDADSTSPQGSQGSGTRTSGSHPVALGAGVGWEKRGVPPPPSVSPPPPRLGIVAGAQRLVRVATAWRSQHAVVEECTSAAPACPSRTWVAGSSCAPAHPLGQVARESTAVARPRGRHTAGRVLRGRRCGGHLTTPGPRRRPPPPRLAAGPASCSASKSTSDRS